MFFSIDMYLSGFFDNADREGSEADDFNIPAFIDRQTVSDCFALTRGRGKTRTVVLHRIVNFYIETKKKKM